MNFGHCKHCWWWKKTTTIADKGYCFYHRNTTKETTYCPDYYNRKNGNKEDGTLDEWINKHPEIQIIAIIELQQIQQQVVIQD